MTMAILAVPRNQWLGEDIKAAIDAGRLHHQLAPMEVAYEKGFPEVAKPAMLFSHVLSYIILQYASQDILDALRQRGHRTQEQDSFGSVVVAIGGLAWAPPLAHSSPEPCRAKQGGEPVCQC